PRLRSSVRTRRPTIPVGPVTKTLMGFTVPMPRPDTDVNLPCGAAPRYLGPAAVAPERSAPRRARSARVGAGPHGSGRPVPGSGSRLEGLGDAVEELVVDVRFLRA